jgi:hypothetical protein
MVNVLLAMAAVCCCAGLIIVVFPVGRLYPRVQVHGMRYRWQLVGQVVFVAGMLSLLASELWQKFGTY